MFLDEKTVIKIWVHLGLNFTIFRGTGPGRTRGTRGVGGGGWMEPLPGGFDMMQYFGTILPKVESL